MVGGVGGVGDAAAAAAAAAVAAAAVVVVFRAGQARAGEDPLAMAANLADTLAATLADIPVGTSPAQRGRQSPTRDGGRS